MQVAARLSSSTSDEGRVTQDLSQRRQLRTKAEELLAHLLTPAGPFGLLEHKEKFVIEKVAQECAELFQRSSSCVEGRNGQLALRHHTPV